MPGICKVLRVAAIVTLASLAGCGSSGGPLDSRLYGRWESRRGFVGTDTIEFRKDGTAVVTAFDGQQKKSYNTRWNVAETTKTQIKLNMRAHGKSTYAARRVKFREDGTFELTEGNKILGRFERKS